MPAIVLDEPDDDVDPLLHSSERLGRLSGLGDGGSWTCDDTEGSENANGTKFTPFPIPDSEDPPIPEHRSEWMNESNSLIPGSDEPPGVPSEKNGGRAVAESMPDMG